MRTIRRLDHVGLVCGFTSTLTFAFAWSLATGPAWAQAPTLPIGPGTAPGSMVSTLGVTPGAGASPFGFLPGAGEMILGGGRPGPAFPRVPASISTPGPAITPAAAARGITAPPPLPIANLAIYGTLALPTGAEAEGPPDGLTLDQALERLVRESMDLRWKWYEIPQARADVLTAGLRANPILYADGQLVPYGKYSRARPGGPTQYDVNISHPFDLSHKRQARTVVAEQSVNVFEAQFQNAVRLQINNLYTAYVDLLAARETLRYAEASVAGLEKVLRVTETLYRKANVNRPDVVRVRIQKEAADIGVLEARTILLRAKQTLAVLLSLPPGQAESLEVRGTISTAAPPITAPEALVDRALTVRPDLAAQRLGIHRAEADVRLARAERFHDVYVLYQPYTFQNNAPFGELSATSWALGATVPIPLFNRNQGVIQRAVMNVTQTQVETEVIAQLIANEVTQAVREYAVSQAAVRHFEDTLLPPARRMMDDALHLFSAGETDALAFFQTQRSYNDTIRQYRDALVRRRRSMLALNTVVGERVLP